MKAPDRSLVSMVAHAAPWLTPIPSAWFVGASAYRHLAAPVPVAVVIALVVELLGISTTYTALAFHDWNMTKRKSDPAAPFTLAVAMVGVYLLTTVVLIAVLEAFPQASPFAPVMFPFLAAVGAVNLATVSRHEYRINMIDAEKEQRKRVRHPAVTVPVPPVPDIDERDQAILDAYRDNQQASYRTVSELTGLAKTTVGTRVQRLESAGMLVRDDSGTRVKWSNNGGGGRHVL